MLTGLKNTLLITAGALVIGIVIGVVIASIRSSFDKNKESLKMRGGIGYYILAVLNAICRVYLTIIRGTPVVVQLMIAYFIVFVSAKTVCLLVCLLLVSTPVLMLQKFSEPVLCQ